MSIKACEDFRTSRLIGTDDFPVLFGIELGGEFGGIDQVAKHHGELPSFRIGRMWCSRERCSLRGALFLGNRLL
jgi:hypothetical protein